MLWLLHMPHPNTLLVPACTWPSSTAPCWQHLSTRSCPALRDAYGLSSSASSGTPSCAAMAYIQLWRCLAHRHAEVG